jgi:hypothetical protein
MSGASRPSAVQRSLRAMPPGLEFREEFVDAAGEARLIEDAARLAFKPFESTAGPANGKRCRSAGVDFNQAR